MNTRFLAALLFTLLPLGLASAGAGFQLEPGVDRPGADIARIALDEAEPAACARLCADTPECQAFTFVQPGLQGEQAMCWLKDEVPEAVASDCCTSGLRGEGYQWGVDRPGADYRDFALEAEQPALCQQACAEDADCRAFTYVRPGLQGDAPRCWLKNEVPEPVASDCCASGVRGGSE